MRLKSEFGDRIVFNGAIDSHHALMENVLAMFDAVNEYGIY